MEKTSVGKESLTVIRGRDGRIEAVMAKVGQCLEAYVCSIASDEEVTVVLQSLIQ